MNTIFRRLASDSDGQDLIEYGLLAAVLSISAIVVVGSIGLTVVATYARVAVGLAAANAPGAGPGTESGNGNGNGNGNNGNGRGGGNGNGRANNFSAGPLLTTP